MSLKIAGSEFDKVDVNFAPVKPGTVLNACLSDVPRRVNLVNDSVSVRVPSRLDVTLLDATKMYPSSCRICDSGSISLGVDVYNTVSARLTRSSEIQVSDSSGNNEVVMHYAELFKRLTDYRGGFNIDTEPNLLKHYGLGSVASLSSAACIAFNSMLGSPFSESELVKIISGNYVEYDSTSRVLKPGMSTGASAWIALKGGFCIISSGYELVFRTESPSNYLSVMGIPKVSGCNDSEDSMLDLLKHTDRFASARTCYLTLMELMPAMLSKDMKRAGDIIWELVNSGPKGLILDNILPRARECMLELRKEGAIPFLPSRGPSIAALVPINSSLDNVLSIYDKYGYKHLINNLANEGCLITH